MLSPTATLPTVVDSAAPLVDRRLEHRESVRGDLWIIDHNGATVLRCRCVDVSDHGVRLRVPLGYGVADGQRYELRSQLSGAASTGGLTIGPRWGTVVRTQIHLGAGDDYLDVGLVLDEPLSVARGATGSA